MYFGRIQFEQQSKYNKLILPLELTYLHNITHGEF